MAKPFNLSSDYLGEELYTVLGLTTEATKVEIKKQFRILQRETHQDTLSVEGIQNNMIDPLIIDAFNDLRAEQNYAYDILYDEDTRDWYDQNLSGFKQEIANRRTKNDVTQKDANLVEAKRRIKLLRETAELQTERRKDLITKKETLQKRREGIRINPAEAANVILLGKEIDELTREIAECDRPTQELNEQFRRDTEEKRAAEKGKEEPEQEIPRTEYLRNQWFAWGRSADRNERLLKNPPSDATEEDLRVIRERAQEERKKAEDFKRQFEEELTKEREAASGTKTEGGTTGGDGSSPRREGATGGKSGADEEEESGDEGGSWGGRTWEDSGFGFGGSQQREQTRGSAKDRARARKDKSQRARREGQQKKEEERRAKTQKEQDERIRKEREDQEQAEQRAQEKQARRDAEDRARQARQEAWSQAKESWKHWSTRQQEERDQAKGQESRREMADQQEAAARRRATRAGKPFPGDEGGTGGEAKG